MGSNPSQRTALGSVTHTRGACAACEDCANKNRAVGRADDRFPRGIDRMIINMTTFAHRKRHYIHDTLQSLFRSDWHESPVPINLILGSEDDSHVRDYAAHPAIRLVPWDAHTNPNLRVNCTLNKIRALRYGDDDATLICEDDIAFSPTWMSSLNSATAELDGEQYVLSLFAPRDLLANAPVVTGKTRIKRYPKNYLQGAQAVFYPSRAIREAVAQHLTKYMRRGSGDELIGRYARAFSALYATHDALVDHIGGVSCFHR